MNQKNLEVLATIIIAVETGGQVYGKGRYNDYTPPYKNTKTEHTCTLGAGGFYGHEAKQLVQMIYDADKAAFEKLDTAGIKDMLSKDWVAMKWKPNAKQKAALIKIISSPVGIECQDKLMNSKVLKMVQECEKKYPKADEKAQMMYSEIRHLGGEGPVKRIFDRCKSDFTLDAIMVSLAVDQKDLTSDNQVGDLKYWSRHVACRNFIEKYYIPGKKATKPVITEKTITICGHGSNRPSFKVLYDYNQQRYSQIAGNGKHKGVVAVRRWKGGLTASQKKKFVTAYKSIIGRNYYSQGRRMYCYTPYSNGLYYSDCSSSGAITLEDKCGCKGCRSFNTAAFYTSSLFESVPVKIEKGHILNPEVLEVGDAIEYVGNDPDRPLQIGHVEFVYSIGETDETRTIVADYQRFLNQYYGGELILKATDGVESKLAEDGDYGPKTKKASLAVWKYMANKYYGTCLTYSNHNFFESCKLVAEKMTNEQIRIHSTLGYILQGVLTGRGYYEGGLTAYVDDLTAAAIKRIQSDKGIKPTGKMDADTWYVLFN